MRMHRVSQSMVLQCSSRAEKGQNAPFASQNEVSVSEEGPECSVSGLDHGFAVQQSGGKEPKCFVCEPEHGFAVQQ